MTVRRTEVVNDIRRRAIRDDRFFYEPNVVTALLHKSFEFHPEMEVPLIALGYAYLPFPELNQLCANSHIANRTIARSRQWWPVVIHSVNGNISLVTRLAPSESVLGNDNPEYTKLITVSSKFVVRCVPPDDTYGPLQIDLYRDGLGDRAVPFISAGADPWTPYPIPRTNSSLIAEASREASPWTTTRPNHINKNILREM